MLGKDFRNLAEAVTRTYGNNPWFFLRELAQNSRDAGAKSIRVKAERTAAGLETLTFADDGRGMTAVHARRFLFRLFASDKAGDKMSAGKYGIGFWTILDFQPSKILVQSRTNKNSWAIVLDANLEAQPVECSLAIPGTTVVLTRPAVFPAAPEFSQTVERELRAYCQYLRRNDRRATMLPVYFHEQNVTVPMSLPGPFSYHFHSGQVEGAVGLADKPLVRLYARGLPVWEGALLNQMSHLQTRPEGQSEIGLGLAQEFLLNGNQLDVTFSRNLVLENKALGDVRKIAEKALKRLLAHSMASAFPRKWHQRGSDYLQALASRLRRPSWKLLLPLVLLVVLPLEIFFLSWFFPAQPRPCVYSFDLSTDAIQYSGATVGKSISELSAQFTYNPPISIWFKVFAAVDYDLQAGFIRLVDPVPSPAPSFQACGPEKTISMRFGAARAGRIFLPLPPGHAIDPVSVFFSAGKRHLTISGNSQGEWSAEIPLGPGMIAYRSCPQIQEQELTLTEMARLTGLPDGLAWPEVLERSLAEACFLTSAEKAARANDLVRELISYDTSESTARSYRLDTRNRQWLARVLAIGKGDCDVINGVHVLFLRKMKIPARLVIGLIGTQGRIQSGLHAWSEYFDRGWQIADASAGAAVATLPTTRTEPSPLAGSDSGAAFYPMPIPGSANFDGLAWPALAIITLALAFVFFLKRKNGRHPSAGMTMIHPDAGKELIMPVIQQALLQPEIWGRESPLWNHPFLPTVSGKPMAISRALALLCRGRLLFFTSHNQLVTALKGRGTPILDLSQEFFAPLRSLFPSAVNLDSLCRLQPQPPSRLRYQADSLLEAVNRLLRKKLKKPTICLLSPGLRETDFFNVSLPAAPRQKNFFFPQCFIAVNPPGKEFTELSALFKINQPLAIFRFLKALHSESLLPDADPQALLKKAARHLLHEYRGMKK